MRGRLGPQAGIPKRMRPKLPPNGVLSNQRGLHLCEKGRGPKDPTVRIEGTREPRRRGAICRCGLSRQPQVRSGQTVGEVRPTSLPSSSTVVTVSAGLHWTDAKHRVPPTSYFLRRSPDSLHRQSADLPCCASETSYLQCYFSADRRDPSDAVLGQVDDIHCCSPTGAWLRQCRQLWRCRSCLGSLWRFRRCSSWTSLTRLLRVPAVVCSSTRWSMSLLCCAMGFRRCSQ